MTTYRRNAANQLAGFTLVEILIVIVIIGLLAGMTTTVVVSARRSVNNSIVSSQMAQLSMALDEYKNKYGEYPPDLSDSTAVMRHIKKRWPRYNVTYDQFLQHIQDGCRISSGTVDDTGKSNRDGQYVWDVRAYVSPLVFWLGGLPDKHGVPSGFYASPKAPLGVSASGVPISRPARAKKEKPFFSFEKKYLGAYTSQPDSELGANYYYQPADKNSLWDDSLGAYVYSPAFCQGDYPIVYFRPSVNMAYGAKFFYLTHSSDPTDGVSCAVPYAQDDSPTWYEEKRFQLIHPGDDGIFGSANSTDWRVVPSKQNTSLGDADNLTNFIDSGTLESLYD
ncbi:MAG: prepilin-type N-terminal cleavage/methylation domain-containing protein [Thermoguttaceae bacterium]|nr:prepilin-type N-terminal cleavage/methylation domain-containing protein [Thermoguttaceae bacterium]